MSLKMLNITYDNYENSFLPEALKSYMKRAKRTGLGKHSLVFYEADNIKGKDELLENIKEIVKDNTDGVFAAFNLLNEKNTLDSIIMYFPKNGGIGRRLYRASAKDKVPRNVKEECDRYYSYDISSYPIELNMAYNYEGTGLGTLNIFATNEEKVYDIIKSKLMMSKKVKEDTKKLFSGIIFGIEKLGVATKWKLVA